MNENSPPRQVIRYATCGIEPQGSVRQHHMARSWKTRSEKTRLAAAEQLANWLGLAWEIEQHQSSRRRGFLLSHRRQDRDHDTIAAQDSWTSGYVACELLDVWIPDQITSHESPSLFSIRIVRPVKERSPSRIHN